MDDEKKAAGTGDSLLEVYRDSEKKESLLQEAFLALGAPKDSGNPLVQIKVCLRSRSQRTTEGREIAWGTPDPTGTSLPRKRRSILRKANNERRNWRHWKSDNAGYCAYGRLEWFVTARAIATRVPA